MDLPAHLNPPVVTALPPYDTQIEGLGEQVGVLFPRQSMKDASGASMMDPKTQVTQLHGTSVLDASTHSFEENMAKSLIREYPGANGAALANVALNAYVNQHGSIGLSAVEEARAAGNSPNTSLCAAIALLGPNQVEPARQAVKVLVELFKKSGMKDPEKTEFDFSSQLQRVMSGSERNTLVSEAECTKGAAMLRALESRGTRSVFVDFVKALAKEAGGRIRAQVVLAAIITHLGWKPLMRKRIPVLTLKNMPWHFRVFSTLVGSAAHAEQHHEESFCGINNEELINEWSFAETAHLALFGARPSKGELFAFSILLGLIVSNGPGTISAQGPKGAVSADGPEAPERVQVNKGYIGFLSHTGYAHGGNGFEAIAFLLDRFRDSGLSDPGDPEHGLNLKEMAAAYAKQYMAYKKKAKAEGDISYAKIPCINHPIFKGEEVNFDPREVFVRQLLENQGSYNIFLDFYHELVQALYTSGVSSNVYCVNIDAVIAVILLKMLWRPYVDKTVSERIMESAAFTTFLFGRMIGTAAEIDDHTNRGRNMDTRSPASQCRYVG